MSVRLLVKQRSEAGGADKATEVLIDQDPITIGRDQTCDVVLAQQAVSRSHAKISRDGTLFFLEDLGSAFGTMVNGHKLPKGEKRLLRNGDVIAIAQFDVTFDRVADALPPGPNGSGDNTAFMARQVVKDVMKGLAAGREPPCFRIMNGPNEGQRIEVQDAQELIIGRDETADVMFKDDLVSRRHCKVRRDWSGTHVEDLGSRNGIKVNRKRVTTASLKDRDELEVGTVRLLYLDPTEVREAPVVLPSEEGEVEVTTASHVEAAPSAEPTPEPKAAAPSEPAPEPAPAAPDQAQAPQEEPEPSSSQASAEPKEDEPVAASGIWAKLPLPPRVLLPLAAAVLFGLVTLIVVIAVLAGA